MREFYFVVSPIKRRAEKDIRVYSVEKTRKEEVNYEEAARTAEGYLSAAKKKTTEEIPDSVREYQIKRHIPNSDSSVLQAEMINSHNNSIEERQERIAFQKRMQESYARRSRMAAAYGKE